jgi:serine/threonine protein kinase
VNVDCNSSLVESLEEKIKINDRQDVTYNSPEVANESYVDHKYDIWSLGWILYELCTLDKPPLEDVGAKSWHPLQLPVNVSDELSHLFRQMTRLESNARPSALDLSNEAIFNSEKKVVYLFL